MLDTLRGLVSAVSLGGVRNSAAIEKERRLEASRTFSSTSRRVDLAPALKAVS